MTKLLISLSAVQTVLLAGMGLKLMAIDLQTDELAQAQQAANRAAATQPAVEPASITWETATANNSAISAEDMRLIIREEIASIGPNHSTAQAPAPRHTTEQVKRAETDFARNFNLVRSRAQTSEGEISNLYAQIAKMPPQSRQAAMTQIAKAISSGEIEARF